MKKTIILLSVFMIFSLAMHAQPIQPISMPFMSWNQSPYVSYNLKTEHDKGYSDGISFVKSMQTAYGVGSLTNWTVYVGVNSVTVYQLSVYIAGDQAGLQAALLDQIDNMSSSSGYASRTDYFDAFFLALEEYMNWYEPV